MIELAIAEAYRPAPSEFSGLRSALEDRSQTLRRAGVTLSNHSSATALKSFFRRASHIELGNRSTKAAVAPTSALANFKHGQEILMRAETPESR